MSIRVYPAVLYVLLTFSTSLFSRDPRFRVQKLLHLTFLFQCRKIWVRNNCGNSERSHPPDILFASLQVTMPKAELVSRWKESYQCSLAGQTAAWARLKPCSTSAQGTLGGFARQNHSVPQPATDVISPVASSNIFNLDRSGSCCPFTSLKMFKIPITVFYKPPKIQSLAKELVQNFQLQEYFKHSWSGLQLLTKHCQESKDKL